MADYIFYTFIVSAVVFSTAIILVYRAYRWLAYVVFAVLLVLSNAATGGVIAYLVGATDFVMFVIPYLLFGGLTAYGFWMSGWLIDEHHAWVRLRYVLYGLAALAALGPLTSYFWLMRIPLNLMWLVLQALFPVMLISQILPPLTWPSKDRTLYYLARVFPAVVVMLMLGSSTVSQFMPDLSQDDKNLLSRITLAAFVLFSLALVLWQAFVNARDKEQAERRALEAARSEAEMKLALNHAEQEYAKARDVALAHRNQLAQVSHDLKQPLSALRVAVAGLERTPGGDSGVLARAVDYVDQLAQSYTAQLTDQGAGQDGSQTDPEAREASHGLEVVDTTTFADLLRQMFTGEAASRGIGLTVRARSGRLQVVPLVAMRIMSNLVSNAIAHAQAKRILIAFRKRAERWVFEVYDDGIGMDTSTLAQALEPGGKSGASDGDGLGLSIVQDLCASHGYGFEIDSHPGRGTMVRIGLAGANSPVS
eukprot:g16287.t1